MQEQLSDKDLIQQVLAGKQQAYSLLIDRYRNYVFSLVLRQVPAREEAEEVAQDVFIKTYRSLADFRGDSKFSTWLYQIVFTTCISFHRKKKDHTLPVEEDYMISITERAGHTGSGTQYAEKRSEKEMLAKAISRLPEADAQVISLFYQYEQSLDEIASILGMTANNVKVKLFRSRQKLKEILEQHYASEISHL